MCFMRLGVSQGQPKALDELEHIRDSVARSAVILVCCKTGGDQKICSGAPDDHLDSSGTSGRLAIPCFFFLNESRIAMLEEMFFLEYSSLSTS